VIGGRIARHTLTRRRAPLVDDGHGNRRRDWAAAVDVDLPGWAVDEAGATEDTTNRDGSSVAYILRGPFTADIETTDRAVLFGDVFEVTGVGRQPGPTALTSHTIVRLTRWEG